MSCNCEPDKKRTYFSSVQLFSEPGNSGIPAGAGILLSQTEVNVCTQCGKAEFSVPDSDMQRWFRRSA